MSNTTINTTTSNNVVSVLEVLRKEWRDAASEYSRRLSKKSSISAVKLEEAKTAMANKLAAFNTAKLESIYDQFLADPSEALRSLCQTHVWRKAKPTTKTINGVKTILWDEVDERFDLMSFLAYATSKEIALSNMDDIYACLKSLGENINALVHADITGEEGGSVGKSKEVLRDLVGLIGVKGVNGRNVDVRFIRSACTKATKLGKIKVVTDKDVAPFIMDMYFTQLNGLQYEMDVPADNNSSK